MKKRSHIRRMLKVLLVIVIVLLVVLLVKVKITEMLYPIKYLPEVQAAAETYDVEPALILAVIHSESQFDPKAVSSTGAQGLMQLMPETFKWIAKKRGLTIDPKTDIWEADVNIDFGVWYLNWLEETYYHDNLPASLAAYNAGMQNVCKWIDDGVWDGTFEHYRQIPFKETRNYLGTVYKRYFVYIQRLNDSKE